MNNVHQALNEIDILVLTSRYEGIPYVLLESMRSKTPIICTDVGGNCEIIKNYHNGILVEKEKPNLLAEKIVELYNDKKLMEKITDSAYKDFLNKLTISRTVIELERIYSA